MSILTRFKTVAVLPDIVWAASPSEGTRSERISPSVANAEFSDSGTVRTLWTNLSSEGPQTVTVKEPAKEWSKKMAKRFDELAILEAFGKLSAEQAGELERLAQDRRNLEYPRSAEEVLWEYKQRRITSNLVNAVREYAHLYNFENRQEG